MGLGRRSAGFVAKDEPLNAMLVSVLFGEIGLPCHPRRHGR